jgi:hypothetical protein
MAMEAGSLRIETELMMSFKRKFQFWNAPWRAAKRYRTLQAKPTCEPQIVSSCTLW